MPTVPEGDRNMHRSDSPRRPAVRRKPNRNEMDNTEGVSPAPDVTPPPEVLELREITDIVRRRHRKAVRRKWEAGEPERLPHPFDE